MIFGQSDGIVYLCEMLKTKILGSARLGAVDFGKKAPINSIEEVFEESGRIYAVEVDDPDMMQEQLVKKFEVTLNIHAPLDYYLSFVGSLEKFLERKG